MTKLDIELQKQTQEVSITEMMQEADNMQISLSKEITGKTEPNQLGE